MTKGKKILAHAVLILASFLSVFPLYYMLCGATNTSIDVVRGKLIPGTYLVENFKSLVANQNLGLAMANSFRNAILMTLITLLVCSIAGYEEVKQIIEKRMREEVYDSLVQDLLRGPADRP